MLKKIKILLLFLFITLILVPLYGTEFELKRKVNMKDMKEIKKILIEEDINQNINKGFSYLAYINPFGIVYFVTLDTNEEELDKCMFLLLQDEQVIYIYPEFYGNQLYSVTEVTDISFIDMNNDGSPDLTVIAEGMTGIGPEGAVPYPVCSVYFNDLKGSYKVKEKINEEVTDKLNSDKNFKTIEQINKLLKKKFEY